MTAPKPRWFDRERVMISTAPTCGISKSGGLLARFDLTTGRKIEEIDPETGAMAEAIDDRLLDDMEALHDGRTTDTLFFVDRTEVNMRLAVPTYYDYRFHAAFTKAMQEPQFAGFTSSTIGDLVANGQLTIRGGHGSAPQDLRVGDVPYIKVSDLRAGLVNINPTNRVPLKWAERIWGSNASGLQSFDLLCPERASRNIGDFCILMPGQEQIMITKEVIVLRPGPEANFDQFYLLWAMTHQIVRDQWNRVVFMQTNREDVGSRYLEIEVPVPPSRERADAVSQPFRQYFSTIATEREKFSNYLRTSGAHHFFVSGAEQPPDEIEVSLDADPEEVA